MKSTVARLVMLVTAAAGIAFYAGRRTAPVPPDAGPPAGEHTAAVRELTLPLDVQRRFGLQFAQVKSRPLGQTLLATGSVQANAVRLAQIRPLARGRIETVHVRLGDRVEAGQPLLAYDNIELGDTIGEFLAALAELRKAEAEAMVAARALDRARSLTDLGALATAELLRREADYKNALAGVESRKAESARIEEKLHRFGMNDVEIARLNPGAGFEYHRERSQAALRAPFAGVITHLSAAPGETIGPDSALMTVADLSTVWVLADVYAKDLSFVRTGGEALVEVASFPGRLFKGTVTYVSDVLDAETRTAKVRIEVPNSAQLLKIDMFATVRIPTPGSRNALVIPAGAVQFIGGEAIAFVRTSAERFELRALVPGGRDSQWVEVLEGLKEGETVVAEGSFLLKSEAQKAALGRHEE